MLYYQDHKRYHFKMGNPIHVVVVLVVAIVVVCSSSGSSDSSGSRSSITRST